MITNSGLKFVANARAIHNTLYDNIMIILNVRMYQLQNARLKYQDHICDKAPLAKIMMVRSLQVDLSIPTQESICGSSLNHKYWTSHG